MRHYKAMLRDFLSTYAEELREDRNFSQEEMAEKLRITPRAYSNLKRGKFCFSILPLVSLLFLLNNNELSEFRDNLQEKLSAWEAAHES